MSATKESWAKGTGPDTYRQSPLGRAFRRLGYTKNADRLIEEARHKEGLAKTLTARDLVVLGVAGIIGAGIFVLVGQGTQVAGVAVVPSFLLAALICVVAGFAYSELASTVPASGSAYAYLYTSLGELPGWMVAWALVLEYAVGAIAVAIGWRNNLVALVNQVWKLNNGDKVDQATHQTLAAWQSWEPGNYFYTWIRSPLESATLADGTALHGILNIPSILIVLAVTLILMRGAKESAKFTTILVFVKVAILLMAIGVGFSLFQMSNLTSDPLPHPTAEFPDAPNATGFGGFLQASFTAAALMFFAYIGFDSVSTTAEETKNPKKDLPIGILGSLGITTFLYILAALALVGMSNWTDYTGNSVDAQNARGEPFGFFFEAAGITWAAVLVRIGALIGTTSVLLVLILGGARVFFNMSRDGLLPPWLSKVSGRGAPAAVTLFYGVMTVAFAGLLDLGKAVELVNIGTLFAFVMVIIAAWIFRIKRPDLERPVKMPLWSIINANGRPYLPMFALLGIAGIAYMVSTLAKFTLIASVAWAGLGLLVYAAYGIRHSKEAHHRSTSDSALRADPFLEGRPAGTTTIPGPGKAWRKEPKAKPAKATPASSRGGYTHKGYTLYARPSQSGKPLYFFAKSTPKSGSPSTLPSGYEVGVNDRTGLPYLRKSAG